MNIIETEITNINTNSRITTYTLQNIDDTYYFSVFPYSKESDFFSNNYGATTELKLGKKVYIDLDKDKNIISLSNKDEVLIVSLSVNLNGEYKNAKYEEEIKEILGLTKEEYKKLVKYNIENNIKHKLK